MSMPEADIVVPQEDGAIQEALADLDRKLAAHAAAVRDAESRLREMAGLQEEPAPSDTEDAMPETAGDPAAEAAEAVDPAGEKTEPVETPSVEQEPPIEEEAHAAASTEEEALLASLDEPTAKAVRVLRRLNPGKPLQELLKQAGKHKDSAGAAGKPAAKSWFRRR